MGDLILSVRGVSVRLSNTARLLLSTAWGHLQTPGGRRRRLHLPTGRLTSRSAAGSGGLFAGRSLADRFTFEFLGVSPSGRLQPRFLREGHAGERPEPQGRYHTGHVCSSRASEGGWLSEACTGGMGFIPKRTLIEHHQGEFGCRIVLD